MRYTYHTKGVCSRKLELEIDDGGLIQALHITSGCHGNSQGLERLVLGRSAAEVKELLRGIRCEEKNTSCPDQLSYAIEEALEEMGQHKRGKP